MAKGLWEISTKEPLASIHETGLDLGIAKQGNGSLICKNKAPLKADYIGQDTA